MKIDVEIQYNKIIILWTPIQRTHLAGQTDVSGEPPSREIPDAQGCGVMAMTVMSSFSGP